MIKWNFPLSNHGTTKGLNDSGIAIFGGEILKSLARESIQNSLDEKIEKEEKVSIEFEYFHLNKYDFPDIKGLKKYLEEAIIISEKLKDQSTHEFFSKATECINQRTIPFLRISDFNTNGLTGSNKMGSNNWNNLVKSTGMSDKSNLAGGSFGIGKSAAFSCSLLHTVFYSTLDKFGIEASQGVTNLISIYKKEYDDYTQGIGYYSADDNNSAITKQFDLQKSFNRKQSGTDIYIAGFIFSKEEYIKEIMKGVIDNYLYAIYKNTLEVRIDDIKINKDSLSDIMKKYEDYFDQESIEIYDLLISKDTLWYDDYDENQSILLGLKVSDKSSRRISAIRKPWMKIKNLSGFSKAVDFQGMLIIQGDNINANFRRMENPQHNDWEPDRLTTNKKIGQQLIKNVKKYINEKIISLNQLDYQEELDLIGASEFIKLHEDNNDKNILEKSKQILESKIKEESVVQISNKSNGLDDIATNETNDKDGEEVEDFQPSGIPSGIPNEEPNIPTKKKQRIRIKRNDMKLAKISNSGYKMLLKTDNDVEYIDVIIYTVSDENKKVEDVFYIVEAHQGDKELKINKNTIENVKLINNSAILEFSISSSNTLTMGVIVNESKQ